ncbi:hypothetical protein G6L28_10725 [Agrobacterium larrymoorei]|uniref:hypothetical protein n=1 Tax=Agrobacterium larrymoorei TaxID=160699 RepID=UPI001572D6A8|nr:hypothetical protein [Agrobacterium larrymoorei]NTJ43070.1 hypothetical protein [Agrobacterium larrymoorei]
MLFGQSVFQSVVTRLQCEAEDMPEEPQASYSIRPTFSGVVFDTAPDDAEPANAALETYLALLQTPPTFEKSEPEPEIMPPHLTRTSLSDVSDELAINERDTLETLSEKRRAFARLNHPDTISPAFRANANLRMTAANLLIDQAIRLIGR